MFNTKVVEFKESGTVLDKIRTLTKEEFIEDYGSGTLRKNNRLGLNVHSQYWEERIAYDFGWEFMIAPTGRVVTGSAISEGDVKGLTELGWHAERYIRTRVFPEDVPKVAYIEYEDSEGNVTKGNGIVIEQTSLQGVGNRVIFAFVVTWNDEKEDYDKAVNPF